MTPMRYEELDAETRKYMLAEYEAELESGNPYVSKLLSPMGFDAFPRLMKEAIAEGDELSLAASLRDPRLWSRYQDYQIRRLALSEFTTWYVRGLARRLIEEGEYKCEIYRGAEPKGAHGACEQHDGRIVDVQMIYDNHRARYWPGPGKDVLAIPYGPNCHHLIRRVSKV